MVAARSIWVSGITASSITVGAILDGPAELIIRAGAREASGPVSAWHWGYGRIDTELEPGTNYSVQVLAEVSGAETLLDTITVRTLDPDPDDFKIITSSCNRTGSNAAVFDRIRTEAPDFFVHQGDLHYEDASTEAIWRGGMEASLTAQRVAAMLRQVPMFYDWDNHDWGGQGSYSGSPVGSFAPTAIRELVGQQTHPRAIYRTWAHKGVRFVELDRWSMRDNPDGLADDDPAKRMLGADQEAWLYQTLQASTEDVIILFAGFPLYSNMVREGRWGSYLAEVGRIATWLNAHPAVKQRLIAVGGDSHSICADNGANAMWGIPSLNCSPLHQSGGLASGIWNIANLDVDDERGYFSRLSFAWADDTVDVTWEAVQDDGAVMATWSKTLPRRDLIPGGSVTIWDGTAEQPATIAGVWDGTALQPVAALEVA